VESAFANFAVVCWYHSGVLKIISSWWVCNFWGVWCGGVEAHQTTVIERWWSNGHILWIF